MKLLKVSLLWRTFAAYTVILVIGIIVLTAKNLWIHQSTIENLQQFFFGTITYYNLVILVILQLVTIFRLREVSRFFRNAESKVTSDRVLQLLLKFPTEIFWGMIIIGFIFSILYHVHELSFQGTLKSMFQQHILLDVIGSFIAEMALTMTIAVMVYCLLRSILKPYIHKLNRDSIGNTKITSLTTPFYLLLTSCFFIITFDVVRTIINSYVKGTTIIPFYLTLVVTVDLLLSISIFLLLFREMQNELQAVKDEIQHLSLGYRDQYHKQIHIIYSDEIGQLSDSFNQVQKHVTARYHRLYQEIELASAVQKMLSPTEKTVIGKYDIQFIKNGREGFGDWFDIIPLDEQRFGVVMGKVVGRQLPAALATSSLLLFIRNVFHEHKQVSLNNLFERLEAHFYSMFPVEMQYYAAITIFNQHDSQVELQTRGPISFRVMEKDINVWVPLHIQNQRAKLHLKSGSRMSISMMNSCFGEQSQQSQIIVDCK